MDSRRFTRRSGWAGILAVGFFAAGSALAAVVGGSGDTPAEVVASYSNSSDNALLGASAVLMGFAIVAFIPFLVGLRERLAADGRVAGLPTVALAGGIAMLGFLGLSSTLAVAVPASAEFFDAYTVSADTAMTLEAASWWSLHFVSLGGTVLVGATALAARQAASLPRWLARAGYPVAAIGLAGLFTWGISLGLEILWLLGTSIVMAQSGRASSRVPRTAVTPA